MSRHERFWKKWDAYWKKNKTSKKWAYVDKYMAPGGFYDKLSFVGVARMIVFGLIGVYWGRYIDMYFWAFDSALDRNVTRDLGSMQWHARVALGLGGPLVILGPLYSLHLLKTRYQRWRTRSQFDSEIAERQQEQGAPAPADAPRSLDEKVRLLIWRYPLLNDLIWGWPMLLALPLIFVGATLDGSPSPGLSGLFPLADLEAFKEIGRTPIAALNGIHVGGIAYAINHNLVKPAKLPFAAKFFIGLCVGGLAIWAWDSWTQAALDAYRR